MLLTARVNMTLLLFLVYLYSCNGIGIASDLPKFWESTGFSPQVPRVENLLSPSHEMNINFIGALPNKGIRYVRVHWLIDLLSMHGENKSIDFRLLDTFLDRLNRSGLYPGFELMGNPYDNASISHLSALDWGKTTTGILNRYTERYGIDVIKNWRFETWNEPDLKMYNVFNYTLQDYITYVNAISKSIRDFNEKHKITLKFGGPAGLFKNKERHPICWGLTSHCRKLKNKCAFTYYSFHKKGDENAKSVVTKSIKLIQQLQEEFPGMESVPFANDESDILVSWWKPKEWRSDTRYAAMAVQVVINFYRELIQKRNLSIEVISFDNAFLNYYPWHFEQRTLLAEFWMNNTSPEHRQYFLKPIYSAMALLSLLERKVTLQTNHLLSTRNIERTTYSTIITHLSNKTRVKVNVTNLPPQCRYRIYTLDNVETNPALVWRLAGEQAYPEKTLRYKMRYVQTPHVSKIKNVNATDFFVTLKMRAPTVALVHVCCAQEVLGMPVRLRVENVTRDEVVIFWSDEDIGTKCVKTYEIEFKPSNDPSANFNRINTKYRDSILLSYQHAPIRINSDPPADLTCGHYRVRAVDYSGNSGPYSKVVTYDGGNGC